MTQSEKPPAQYVPMNPLFVGVAWAWQVFSAATSFLMLNYFLTVFSNNMDFFGGPVWWPTLDGPTHFPLWKHVGFLGERPAKWFVNSILLFIWHVQHIFMARHGFKNWCYRNLGTWYAAFERSNFLFLSAVSLYWISVYWQRDTEVIFETTKLGLWVVVLGYATIAWGFGHFLWTMWEMRDCDIWGFNYSRQLTWSGFDFPLKESMKPLSRFNMINRHSIYFCLFLFFGGALLTTDLTYGKLVNTGFMIVFTAYGSISEENDCRETFGKEYENWLELIPNRWVPNFKVLSMSDEDLAQCREALKTK